MGHLYFSVLITLILSAVPLDWTLAKVQATKCGQGSLDRKNCILQRGAHRIQFRDETMNSFDGVHRSLGKIPIVGEKIQWHRIEWKMLAKRQFIEIEIWEAPKTEGELSSLRWFVFEVAGVELKPVLDQTIRRRKKIEGKSNFEMDKLRKYQLFIDKKEVRWKVDFESGVIK